MNRLPPIKTNLLIIAFKSSTDTKQGEWFKLGESKSEQTGSG